MKICVVDVDSQTVLKTKQGENLLTTLNAQHILSKSACRNGNCRICRCRLIKGVIDYQNKIPLALSIQDKEQGWILPCISTIVGDIQISDIKAANPK